MNEQFRVNRVEMELNQWRLREERFNKLFSFNLSSNKSLLEEKLRDYERIAAKYKTTQNTDERIALRVLRLENARMIKLLHPNLLVRLFRKVVISPLFIQALARRESKELELNIDLLHAKMQRIGFPDLSARINQHITEGQEKFSIPLSYYISEKEKINHQLSFSKDTSGRYQLEGYKSTLQNELNPENNRQQYFKLQGDEIVDLTQAYNLLAGRSVQIKDFWQQLDFNDKDPQGNHRIKEFPLGYGYDLEKIVRELPLKKNLDKREEQNWIDSLKQGSRISVIMERDGNEHRFYIEANPQYRSVNIFDERDRKITLAAALGNKTLGSLKQMKAENEQNRHSLSLRNSTPIN